MPDPASGRNLPAPGARVKSSQRLSLFELLDQFRDDDAAEKWFIENRWPGGIVCPYCGGREHEPATSHRRMPFRCSTRGCRKFFSVKTMSAMHGSKLGYRAWVVAIHLLGNNPKGSSSFQLHRHLGITQKSA